MKLIVEVTGIVRIMFDAGFDEHFTFQKISYGPNLIFVLFAFKVMH